MKKLSNAVDRFCALHPNFGVPNLMKFIVAGNILVYLLAIFSNGAANSFLAFHLSGLLHGEVWRLVSFIFVPISSSAFSLILSLYLYYFIGNVLEREWGSAKFTLYYISGAVLSLLGTILISLITGNHFIVLSGTFYINMSMFFAFAMLYPDMQLLLFFLIPIKIKWLAVANGFVFLVGILQSLMGFFRTTSTAYLGGVILPIIALLNFAVFFAPHFFAFAERKKYQHSRQSTQYRRTTRKAAQAENGRSYHHKCAVCGKTDAEFPNLAFRYCSRCAGYHCYCEEHIFNHEHFTE